MVQITLRLSSILLLFAFSVVKVFCQTTLKSSEQSNVGGSGLAANFVLLASSGGQPSPIGNGAGGQFSLSIGFVSTLSLDLSANRPPAIQFSPVTIAQSNEAITIGATITDDGGLSTASLNYRQGGASTFTAVSMTNISGSDFEGTIPASSVASRGVEYFFQAADAEGLIARAPFSGIFSVRVNVADPGVVRATPQASGSEQTAYRLISIPIGANNKNAGAVLEDDLGSYDNTKWRFFELRSNQDYAEFPGTSGFTAGKSFFLIVKDAGKVIDTGAGSSNITSQEFAINLNSRWNFIANPFNFAIPQSNIRLESGAALDIRSFAGQFAPFSSALEPFDGYAIFVENSDKLFIDPLLSPPATVANKTTTVADNINSLWTIQISAFCQNALDTYNFATAIPDAAIGWDEYDRPEAPVIGEYVSLYFPHPEWGKASDLYTTDARPEPLEGEIWEFAVRSNIRDEVKLHFEGTENVPEKFEIWLVDETVNIATNLRESITLSIGSAGERKARHLKLIVGSQQFLDTEMTDIQSIPNSFELSQNFPNPFNPSTTIRYSLPSQSNVTLKIYNLLGKEITVLVDEEKAAGLHLAVWNGMDSQGHPVASGIYVYQLRTNNITLTKKMAFLK